MDNFAAAADRAPENTPVDLYDVDEILVDDDTEPVEGIDESEEPVDAEEPAPAPEPVEEPAVEEPVVEEPVVEEPVVEEDPEDSGDAADAAIAADAAVEASEEDEAPRREYWDDSAPKPQAVGTAAAVADETGEPQNASGVKVHPASVTDGVFKVN